MPAYIRAWLLHITAVLCVTTSCVVGRGCAACMRLFQAGSLGCAGCSLRHLPCATLQSAHSWLTSFQPLPHLPAATPSPSPDGTSMAPTLPCPAPPRLCPPLLLAAPHGPWLVPALCPVTALFGGGRCWCVELVLWGLCLGGCAWILQSPTLYALLLELQLTCRWGGRPATYGTLHMR